MAMDHDEDDDQVSGYPTQRRLRFRRRRPMGGCRSSRLTFEEIDWYDENPIEGESMIEWDAPHAQLPWNSILG